MTIAKWTCMCPKCENVFTHEVEVTDNFAHTLDVKPDNIRLMTTCPSCGEYIELGNKPMIQINM